MFLRCLQKRHETGDFSSNPADVFSQRLTACKSDYTHFCPELLLYWRPFKSTVNHVVGSPSTYKSVWEQINYKS